MPKTNTFIGLVKILVALFIIWLAGYGVVQVFGLGVVEKMFGSAFSLDIFHVLNAIIAIFAYLVLVVVPLLMIYSIVYYFRHRGKPKELSDEVKAINKAINELGNKLEKKLDLTKEELITAIADRLDRKKKQGK